MTRFALILLSLYGGWFFVSKYYKFDDTLAYAQKHPGSKLSAPTEYWVGMVYYQRGDYPKAKEAFAALLEQHPTDHYYIQKAIIPYDDAAGYTFDWETSKMLLQRYLDEYPDGKNAELARKRLEMVKYNHP